MFEVVLSTVRLPDPEAIRRTAREVIEQGDYQISPPPDNSAFWEWLLRLLKPLFELFEGLSEISPVLAWGLTIGLVVLLFALVGHIVYTFVQALSGPKRPSAFGQLTSKVLDPRQFENESKEAAGRQDYIGAVRLLFLAALVRLEQREKRRPRPGMTNRDYLRRYRGSNVFEPLRLFVEVIDAKWYGHGSCDAGDYQNCCQAYAEIVAASEVKHAHAA